MCPVVKTPVVKPRKKTKTRKLPPYRVLLHNDNVNQFDLVLRAVKTLTILSKQESEEKVAEAHFTDVSLLLITHKERAELYEEQFRTYKIKVTIEPA